MKKVPIARILVTLFFVGLLMTPAIMRRYTSAHSGSSKTTLDRQTALSRHGFYLEEVSHAAGINFLHEAPTFDPKLDKIMPEVASMGASVSIVDFDRDGWPDIYVTNSGGQQKSPLSQHARWHIQRCC
jgi:enediyne biosynthesis protein E4